MELRALDAVLYSVCVMMLAAVLHFALFWGNSKRLCNYSLIGTAGGLIGFIVALVFLVTRQFLDFV
jgi:hypothetical protein